MTIINRAPAVSAPGLRVEGLPHQAHVGDLQLESGFVLPDVVLSYETWGELTPDASNAVLIEHALTGDPHVATGHAGPFATQEEIQHASSTGWWQGLVGPGAVIDTDRYFVVCANILGGCYGSTGPSSAAPESVDPARAPWGSRFPRITIRDAVNAEVALADLLGIQRWRLVVGGSMGGARALEWAVMEPDRVQACVVAAANAQVSAEQLAWGQTQALAIEMDPNFKGGDYYGGPAPEAGLGLARRIAHVTYRCAAELDMRFGRTHQDGEDPAGTHLATRGRYQVESYLDHQASKLVGRFDANSYLSINETLMSHDVTRGRGSLEEALSGVTCDWLIIAVDSDRLFFPRESEELARALPGSVPVHTVNSPNGHDGFLLETRQMGDLIRQTVLSQE